MTLYAYRAKRGPEETVDGEIEAVSHAAAVAQIDRLGYSPVWVRERTAPPAAAARRRLPRRAGRRDVAVFTRQMSSLSRAAVPILRALSALAQQTENPAFAKVVRAIDADVRNGRTLSEALARHPRLFSPLYVSLVQAGESGGVLDEILTRLTVAQEREEDIRRRTQAALAYPAVILATGAVTIFVLFAFFLPRVAGLFRDFSRLPLPTRILIGSAEFFRSNWHWLALFLLLAGAVLHRLATGPVGRLWTGGMALRVPGLRGVVLSGEMARFARTLAALLNSGIAIDRALNLSAATVRNGVLNRQLLQARETTVRQGMRFSEALCRAPALPAFAVHLIAVGEEGGRLPESLTEIADFYEKELEQQGRILTSILEPLLILAVGSIVGLIVAAMLLPIFELGTGLR
jgi:type IV pilus assembly protein PilC